MKLLKLLTPLIFLFLGATAWSQNTQTDVYGCSGSSVNWEVPDCVTSIDIVVAGAAGGGPNGGMGATVSATIPVAPGDILQINVGCSPNGINGGYNGGGNTGNGQGPSFGGGGASDIRVAPYGLNDRFIVAGGGGGQGGGNPDVQFGGDAGCGTGLAGETSFGDGGNGGTQNSGGQGGAPYTGGNSGQNGSLGQGGNGGIDNNTSNSHGGGGGGGYYGGGGGGSDFIGFTNSVGAGGGGGGSSLTPAGGNCNPASNGTDGYIEITYTIGPDVDPLNDQEECDSYTLPTITGTNLTGGEAYYDGPNGTGTQYNPGDNITTSMTLYIYDGGPNCPDEEVFDIIINTTPDIDPLNDQEECGNYTLPQITGIDLTGNEAYYDGPNGTGTQYNPGDIITTSMTLYIYDETGTTPNCFDEEVFDITINTTPDIDPLNDQEECDSYLLPQITGTDLTGNEAYYDGPSGTGTQYNSGDIITTSMTLYIYDETGTIPNCFDEESFNIVINATPNINPLGDQEECDNYLLPVITGTDLTGNEAYYDGPNGTGTQYNSGDNITTSMTLYIYDETGTVPNCFDEEVFDITINTTPDIDPLSDQEVCNNYTLPQITGTDLTGNEAYYDGPNGTGTQYNPGDNIPANTTIYIYDETGTIPNCFDEESFDINIATPPNVTISATSTNICDGESVTLSGNGADNYVWDNGIVDGVSFSPNTTTTYEVTGTDQITGCQNTAQITITVNPIPNVSFTGTNLNGCSPLVVTFNNTTGNTTGTCTWEFGDGDSQLGCSSLSHTFVTEGCYDVTLNVVDGNGCESSVTYSDYVCVYPNPVADFTYNPANPDITNNEVVFNNSSVGGDSYQWLIGSYTSSSDENPVITLPEQPEEYPITLVATTDYGCTDTAESVIIVDDVIIFYVPNTFTPDNNSRNDIFKPTMTSGFDMETYHLVIYNRWGEIIFESFNPNVGWDGMYQGNLAPDGVYVWRINVTSSLGVEKEYQGHVNLLK